MHFLKFVIIRTHEGHSQNGIHARRNSHFKPSRFSSDSNYILVEIQIYSMSKCLWRRLFVHIADLLAAGMGSVPTHSKSPCDLLAPKVSWVRLVCIEIGRMHGWIYLDSIYRPKWKKPLEPTLSLLCWAFAVSSCLQDSEADLWRILTPNCPWELWSDRRP